MFVEFIIGITCAGLTILVIQAFPSNIHYKQDLRKAPLFKGGW